MTTTLPSTSTPEGTTFASRLVDRAAAWFDRTGVSRRGFLYRAAVVGSAMVVNPFEFVFKPMTAYASVCGDAASCGGGWSAFCCTVNDGKNTCPPGSYVAGWWKVDDSAFCLGAPRYYIDCNRTPSASCSCRCADGACDKRRVCCNVFRYGQCNTQVAGVTEVVCRVVTCTPPWEWDPACGTTVRVSPATRTHSASCLPGTNPTRIQIKYQDLGLRGSVLGDPTSSEHDAARGGRFRRYQNGLILYLEGLGAHHLHGRVAERYEAIGRERGPIGYPTADQRPTGVAGGQVVVGENGAIYRTPDGRAWEVAGAIFDRYLELGGPGGTLGFPTSGQQPLQGGGAVSRFERGAVFSSRGTGTHVVSGPFLTALDQLGGPAGSGLGLPLGPARSAPGGGRQQPFQHGVIVHRDDSGTFGVRSPIADRFLDLGGVAGPWGFPTAHQRSVGDGRGEVATFASTTVWTSPDTGPHALSGPVLARYEQAGGPTGVLGYPTTDVFTTRTGRRRASFEHGAIVHDPGSGSTEVVRPRATRDAGDVVETGTAPPGRPTRGASELPDP